MFLWAGRLVAGGSLPYRDFPFAQAPMLAYAYPAASLWVAWRLRGAPARIARVAAVVGAQAVIAFLPVLRAPAAAFFHVVTAQFTRVQRFGYLDQPPVTVGLARALRAYPDLLPDAAA